jgi:phosphate uptake regulator
MIAPKHILGTFDEALGSLRNSVLMMSSLTERSLDRAITGLLQRDDNFVRSRLLMTKKSISSKNRSIKMGLIFFSGFNRSRPICVELFPP